MPLRKPVTGRGLLRALLLLLAAAAGSAVLPAWSAEPCEAPLTYRLEAVDRRFAVDRGTVEEALEGAVSLWEAGAGRRLFRRARGEPDLEIRLVFDRRQQALRAHERRRERIDRARADYQDRREALQARLERFRHEREAHEEAVRAFERRQRRHAQRVERWNRGDLAHTAERRRQLEAEREALRQRRTELNRRGEALRAQAESLNQAQRRLRGEGDAVDEEVRAYNRVAEQRSGFQAGRYRGRGREGRITVYQFRDPQQLRTVLAHELGHALGIGHVSGHRSVMYRELNEANRDPRSLSAQDRAALRRACGWR